MHASSLFVAMDAFQHCFLCLQGLCFGFGFGFGTGRGFLHHFQYNLCEKLCNQLLKPRFNELFLFLV